MSKQNKIFLDSSILIEFEKQSEKSSLFVLLQNSDFELYINAIVASEYLYKLIGIIAQKSPMAVCESNKIKEIIEQQDIESFLSIFSYLEITEESILFSVDLMKKHNLLPNDAMILATCLLQNIKVLASHDTDFALACQNESILLLKNDIDFNNFLKE